jgi:hypothetical protein
MSRRPLKIVPPTLLPRPDERTRAALLALRALYRDRLDQRGLDSGDGTSVDRGPSNQEDR